MPVKLPKLQRELLRRESSASRSGSTLSPVTMPQLQDTISEDGDNEKLEDQMTHEKLSRLQAIFEEADEDGGGGLDMEEFRRAMRKTMGQDVHDEQMDMIFMKVDTNCDGTVDWDEYLSYTLLEYRERDLMSRTFSEMPFPKAVQEIPYPHFDIVVQIGFMPTILRHDIKLIDEDYAHGKYFTISKNGILDSWTVNMDHLKSFVVENPNRSRTNAYMWITDMVCMPNVNMIAVGSTLNEITVYDVNGSRCDKIVRITKLDACPTCMAYWFDPTNINKAKILWGDVDGSVSCLELLECSVLGTICLGKNGRHRIPYDEIIRGGLQSMRGYKRAFVHNDWVLKLKYCPSIDSFISCCRDTDTAMFMGSFELKKPGLYYKVKKGIFSFDYCKSNNIIVSGGYDGILRVWNAFINAKASFHLPDHKQVILHIVINSLKEQVISIDRDKVIKVFDLTTQKCIQTLSKRSVKLGKYAISSVCLNSKLQSLLVANDKIVMFDRNDMEDAKKESQLMKTHSLPVCASLYSHLFNTVITASHDSWVRIWDLDTGKKAMEFRAHRITVKGCDIDVEITAISFDPTGRRLITGARNGACKIWNFNNGDCLRELDPFSNDEITGIICAKQRIYLSSWNRTVMIFMDSYEDENRHQWSELHKEDILSIAMYDPSYIATSSYDGDIIVWYMDTGSFVCRLHAQDAVSPSRVSGLKPKLSKVKETMETVRQTDSTPTANEHNVRFHLPPIDSSSRSDEDNSSDSSENTDGKQSSSKHWARRESLKGNCKKHNSTVDKIIFLQSRKFDRDTAQLLACGSGGWIRAWSIHHQGGLIGQFNAANSIGESVLTVHAYNNDEYLITGDSTGYIKIWYIKNYCNGNDVQSQLTEAEQKEMKKKFPYLNMNNESRHAKIMAEVTEAFPPPKESHPEETMREPPILNSFRAHCKAITYVDVIESKQLMITSSADCCVRLWTICGRFIGTFGHASLWKRLDYPIVPAKLPKKLPTDLKRIASATTLRVMNAGNQSKWKFARNIIMIWMNVFGRSKVKDSSSEENISPTKTPEPLTDVYLKGHRGSLITETDEKCILGKAYQPKKRHQITPILAPCRNFQTQVAVYSSLPCAELEKIPDVQPSPVIQEIMERKRLMEETSLRLKQRNNKALKAKFIATSTIIHQQLRQRKDSQVSHNSLKVSVSKRRMSRIRGQSITDATVKVPEKSKIGREKVPQVNEETVAKLLEKLDLGKISEE
ncbi:unnamed protein product [Owenia fusiformis]|uniref:WD repeat-containing protein on Y chromosome n=1 Tax=Owenia fusiformis TaxID=6347 RepID=A0A8S4PH01_OWEFU|nr:unnamed protein product [Owenia fusiformis]